ncbi:MAG: chromosome segregation protein SMC [Pseudomonadota bacterium]
MKFTKLRIAGFKSFVEPTELLIEDGLTGVVGPNGCGKSNLVEAMRWVMGESSYKAMRAGGMEEVIFSGSGKRPARDSAEVKLFLDNSSRRAPAAFNEHEQLEVARKIARDRGSDYRVNGREARARDVQLMFADAASGARSPSMVRQGQIGEIIAAKPIQRRALLEEAAGISGLHTRRHEAELRLRAAETNIERLDDVIGELDRQLDGLRRQARQAARFREVAAKTRTAEAGVFALKWSAANQASNEANRALHDAAEAMQKADEAQLSAATEQASVAARVPDARTKAAEKGAALGRLIRARDDIATEEKRIAERLEAAEAQLKTLDADLTREAGLSDDHAGERSTLDAELAAVQEAKAKTTERMPALEQAAQEAEALLTKARSLSNEARNALSEARAEKASALRIRETARNGVARLEGEADKARLALADLPEANAFGRNLRDERAKVQALRDARDTATQAVTDTETARMVAMATVADAESPLRASEKTLTGFEAEIAALEKLVGTQNGEAAEGAPVLDALNVEPGLETALSAALGEALSASTDDGTTHFWRVIGSNADPSLPEGVSSLAQHVEAPDALARVLAQIGVVGRSNGAELQAELLTGQMLVSRDGDLWRWDGLTRTAGAPDASAVKLLERNRLADLITEADELRVQVDELRTAHMVALTSLTNADKASVDARAAEAEARRALDLASSGLLQLEKDAERDAARRDAAEQEVARVTAALDQARLTLSNAETQVHGAAVIPDLEAKLGAAEASEEEKRRERDTAGLAFDQVRRESADHDRRREAAERALEAWQRRAEAAAAHLVTLGQRRSDCAALITKLRDEPGRLVQKRRELAHSVEKAGRERSVAADALAQLEASLRDVDAQSREAKDTYFKARETHGRAEERKAAADERRAALQAAILETVDAAPHELMTMAGFEPGKQPPALDVLERQLAELRDARQRLGAVNLQAEQEADEVAQRRDTLGMERDDVAEAIAKLRSTISTLNREGRVKLLEAFDRVNNQFQHLFTRLFGGGEAELTLIDADDPLEAGLDIIARPPGKKPQSITLLSGGEQALTAMALIFAVFLSNPAPICILDEVDAPLDDANVERFCNLLQDMVTRTSTRFLVVTHNPITMSRMHRLFGVTMAEKGVSQIVSVVLAEAEVMVGAENAA